MLGVFLWLAFTDLRAAANHGPNLLVNGGFEGNAADWSVAAPFVVSNNIPNAHTGSWELEAVLGSTPTYQYTDQPLTVWPNTNYTSTFWVKGSGSFQFGVLNTSNNQTISVVNVTAGSGWQQISLSWNSGAVTNTPNNVAVYVADTLFGNTGRMPTYMDDFQTYLAAGNDIQFDPSNPGAFGYSLVFDDEFNNPNTIDSNHTGAAGYNWYLGQYFGLPSNPSSMYSVSAGVLNVMNCQTQSGMTLHTTEPDSTNGRGFHGTVFSAGAGIYFEARIAIPNPSGISGSTWPSFWSEDLKLETFLNRQMPGNPADYEGIEDDFMEYNPAWESGVPLFSTIHDWSGTIASGPSYNTINYNSDMPPPVGTDMTQWHTYGLLWVPASAANGWIGYRQCFLDGVAQEAVCWQGNQIGTFPPSGSYLFSLKDKDQFDMILGASATGSTTMQVDYVHVYAVNASSVTVVLPGQTAGLTGTDTPTLPPWALGSLGLILVTLAGRFLSGARLQGYASPCS